MNHETDISFHYLLTREREMSRAMTLSVGVYAANDKSACASNQCTLYELYGQHTPPAPHTRKSQLTAETVNKTGINTTS